QPQGDGTWRYYYTGSLAEGTVEVVMPAGSVADIAGNLNQGTTCSFVYDITPPQVADVRVAGTAWSVPDYSIPVGSAAQLYPLGWSTIDQIEIFFDEDVIVNVNDLILSGTSLTYAFSNFSYDPVAYKATWTLGQPLDVDVLLIDLQDAVHDYAGNALDGDWLDEVSTYPSGDGSAGTGFQFTFKVLPGNATNNNIVDGGDYTNWADYYHTFQTLYHTGEFNADGYVDGGDYTIWADHYGETAGAMPAEDGPPAV
ncbi:unnamed protein product, partial [marine sediment metagenome]